MLQIFVKLKIMLKQGGIITDIRKLPKGVLLAVFAMAIYRIGWAAGDAYFSVYLESVLENYALVGVVSGIITLVAAFLTIPVGVLCDHVRKSRIIAFGFSLYPIAALAYFFAGVSHSVVPLIIAVVVHGLAVPFVWTASESYIRSRSTRKDASRAFGLFDSGRIIATLALLAFVLFIDYIPVYFIFLPIIIFSLISTHLAKNLPNRRVRMSLEKLWRQMRKHHHFLKDVTRDIAHFNSEMHIAMTLTLFIKFVSALGALFIPLYAINHDLPLSKIGLLMALMSVPSILSFLFAELADRGEKIATIMSGIIVVGLSALGLFVWQDKTWAIFSFSLIMMIGLTMIRPAVYGIVTNLSVKRYAGLNTALQNIMQRIGHSVAAVAIGLIANWRGIEFNFILLTVICLILIVTLTLLRLRWKLKNKLYHLNHPKGHHEPYSL